jgi:hypothetical protein
MGKEAEIGQLKRVISTELSRIEASYHTVRNVGHQTFFDGWSSPRAQVVSDLHTQLVSRLDQLVIDVKVIKMTIDDYPFEKM